MLSKENISDTKLYYTSTTVYNTVVLALGYIVIDE
jgi:hypothetical protein